jgi:hypothetical protein
MFHVFGLAINFRFARIAASRRMKKVFQSSTTKKMSQKAVRNDGILYRYAGWLGIRRDNRRLGGV